MSISAYLDNNATTRPLGEVLDAMRRYQEELFFNASSVAGELLGAAEPITRARSAMRTLLGAADEDDIIFTSGATEANSWVIFGSLLSPSHVVSCALEHSSLLAALHKAASRGHRVDFVGVGASGLIDRDELRSVLRPTTRLVSIQFANNETGAIQPLAEIAATVRDLAPQALVHTDATQAIGREAIDLSAELADVDLLSFSAHKFHGPKGIGGLFIREGVNIEPLIPGEQEKGLRGGTLNVPAAAGLAIAAQRARARLPEMSRVAGLRDDLEKQLLAMHPDAYVHASGVCRLPNTSLIAFPGSDAEHMVEQLAWQGICVATGSACTAGAAKPSHVLTAMGVKAHDARATIRFSLSADTTQSEVERTAEALAILLRKPGVPT